MKWILVMLLFLSACGESTKKGKFEPDPQSDMGAEDANGDAAQLDAGQEDASFDSSVDDASIDGTPCAALKRSNVDFETVVVGNSATQIVQIENCSDTVPLTVNLTATAPISLLAATRVEPGDVADIQMVFSPTTAGQFATQVPIQTSAGALVVSVVGFGVAPDNLCPTARITTGIGSTASPLMVPTGSNVRFSGLSSTAQQGMIATYSWAILSRPAGSTVMFSGSNTQPEVELLTQTAGVYVVELTVRDSLGLVSCMPARLNVQAVDAPAKRFRITLLWDTPADLDQTDTVGTDMDLHYLHPLGEWDKAPYDIFWRNSKASWATDSVPELTIDDTDGMGPEEVEHDAPVGSLIYKVGVYYYADQGLGVSNATVSVFVDGLMTFQTQAQPMSQQESFWSPVTINGANSAVTATNSPVVLGFPATP